jgi:hypothetical protein
MIELHKRDLVDDLTNVIWIYIAYGSSKDTIQAQGCSVQVTSGYTRAASLWYKATVMNEDPKGPTFHFPFKKISL